MSEVVERTSSQPVRDLQMVRLGDHLNVIRGASPRPKGDPRYFGGDIPWISISDITREPGKYLSRTREFVTRAGAEKSRLLPAGTLILSNSGTVCVPKILRVDGCIHDGFVAFPDLPDSFDKHYLYWFFEYVRPSIIEANRQGITQVNLNTGIVREIRLPLTSIERQREIVAELEKQFSRLDEAVANLQRVKANLKRYKAAVLKAAVEGRLVETEAALARREGRTYETGKQLLQRILIARQSQWAGRGRYKEPEPTKEGETFTLPDGWCWASLEQLHLQIADVDHKMPKAIDDGIPYVSTKDFFGDEGINFDAAKRISLEDFNALSRKVRPENGDILLSRYGTVGEVRLVTTTEPFQASYSVAILKPVRGLISVNYLASVLRSEVVMSQIKRDVRATAQPDLGLAHIRQFVIPLPSLAEQARIVAEVDRHLSIIREVEAEVDANLQRAQALQQATLAKVFGS